MDRISDKKSFVSSMKFTWGAVAYFSHEHEDEREWDILGSAAALLEHGNTTRLPTFALKQESPDFMLYDSSRLLIAGCEVTEVLRPGYRRHSFHKDAVFKPPGFQHGIPESIDNQWEPLTKLLRKKALRPYISDSWLLVYYDIGMLETDDWDTPFHERLLAELELNQLQMAEEEYERFHRILILSPNMKSLTEIYPNPNHTAELINEES